MISDWPYRILPEYVFNWLWVGNKKHFTFSLPFEISTNSAKNEPPMSISIGKVWSAIVINAVTGDAGFEWSYWYTVKSH